MSYANFLDMLVMERDLIITGETPRTAHEMCLACFSWEWSLRELAEHVYGMDWWN